jgi:hypothetical protein
MVTGYIIIFIRVYRLKLSDNDWFCAFLSNSVIAINAVSKGLCICNKSFFAT